MYIIIIIIIIIPRRGECIGVPALLREIIELLHSTPTSCPCPCHLIMSMSMSVEELRLALPQ
jgi:hypothetical protein